MRSLVPNEADSFLFGTVAQQWTGRGKAVRNFCTNTSITCRLCTGRATRRRGPVDITRHLSVVNPDFGHGFSTAVFNVSASVDRALLPINHSTYNNNDFLNINNLLFLIGEVA
jgi:hypothetical protein